PPPPPSLARGPTHLRNPRQHQCPPPGGIKYRRCSPTMSFLNKIGKLIAGTSSAPAASVASRSVAKERLSVILAAQRGTHLLEGVNMEALQRDVMEVVQKHVRAAKARTASFNIKNEGECQLFEMSVELNDVINDARGSSGNNSQ
ncbi:hypothetical protein ACHAXR_010096, partial [Thalassiosira sp. AJA248-18]